MLALFAENKKLLQCIKASHEHAARALTPTLSLSISLTDAFEAFESQAEVILGKKPCQFKANGKLVFTGYIDKVSAGSEKLETTISLRSSSSILIDSNFELKQANTQQSIAIIIKNIVNYFDLQVEDLSNGKTAKAKTLFRYESDEKAFEVLSRYAKLAGVYFSTNENGVVTVKDINLENEAHTLKEYTALSVSQNNAKLFASYEVKTTEWSDTHSKEDKAKENDNGTHTKKVHIEVNEDTSENAKNIAETNKQNARRESLSVNIKASPINYELSPDVKVVIPSIAKGPFMVEKITREWEDSAESMSIQLTPNAGKGELFTFSDFLKNPSIKELV